MEHNPKEHHLNHTQRTGAIAAAVITVFGGVMIAFVEDRLDDNDAANARTESVTDQPAISDFDSPQSVEPVPATIEPTNPLPVPTKVDNLEPGCKDLGDRIPGTVCVNPQTGSPGDSFVISGYGFPADRKLELIEKDLKFQPDIFYTDSDGTFSMTVTPDEIECTLYEFTLLDYPIDRLGEFTYETLGC